MYVNAPECFLKWRKIEGDEINPLIENELDENMNLSMMVRKPIQLKTTKSLGEIKNDIQ